MAPSGTEGHAGTAHQSTRLRGGDAVRLHLTLAAGLTLCTAAFVVELWRALGGHSFSWIYVFEWPLFAGFAIYMWWNLLQGNDRGPHTASKRRPPTNATPLVPDADLDAWNMYLKVMDTAEEEDPARPE